MNKIWILAVILQLTGNSVKAQSAATNNNISRNQVNKIVAQPPIKITKGYYAIYRNTEKLNHLPVTVVVDNNSANNFTKGFYAISNKHTQLHKGGKSFIVTTPRRPLTTKGYYSIKPPATSISEENLIADGADTTNVAREEN